jgi:hypothetical protein
MTIYWCGGEDFDFPMGATLPLMTGSGGRYRSNYTRAAMYGGNLYLSNPFSPPQSTVWIGGQCYFYSGSSYTGYLVLRNSTNNDGWAIGKNAASKLTLRKLNTDGSWTDVASESGVSFVDISMYKIDLKINIATSGYAKCYVNGVLMIDYSGNTSLTTNQVDQCGFIGAIATDYVAFSEFVVADTDTRNKIVKVLYPNSNGDANTFINNYSYIDEITVDDTDFIYTTTANTDFQCALSDMPSGTFICDAVRVIVRCLDSTTSGMNIKIGVKTNNTLNLSDPIAPGAYWNTLEKMYQVNPVTSARFSAAEITALQLAIKSAAV